MGYDALCSFTQHSRPMKLPERLREIILIHPQKQGAFGQRNTASGKGKGGDGMHKREALSGESEDGNRKGMKDINASVLKCLCFLSPVEVLYVHFSQSFTAIRLWRKAPHVFP